MKAIKATKNFTLNGVPYEKGDDVEINDIKEVVKLNEAGFINPLNAKDLYNIKKELENNSKVQKKEE